MDPQLAVLPKSDLQGTVAGIVQDVGLVLAPAMRSVAAEVVDVAFAPYRAADTQVTATNFPLPAGLPREFGGTGTRPEKVETALVLAYSTRQVLAWDGRG